MSESPPPSRRRVSVHTSATATQAELVRSLLQNEGIGAEIRGSSLGLGIGSYGVWVEARNEVRAREVLRTLDDPSPGETLCPNCSEPCPSNFERCWKCGATIPLEPNPS